MTRLPAIDLSGFRCPECGYDLSGAASWICAECGSVFSELSVEAQRDQRDYCRNAPAGLARLGFTIVGCWMVAGLSAAMVAGRRAILVETALVGASFGIGLLAAQLTRPRRLRPVHRWLWVYTVLWLHAPVVLAPAVAGAAKWAGGVVGLLLGRPAHGIGMAFVACAFVPWLLLLFWCLFQWGRSYMDRVTPVMEQPGAPTLIGVAATVVFLLSLAWGAVLFASFLL